MFNKESERYLSDDHLKNGDQVFESAFSNQGPEFESAFQEEKAEKRHFFLTFVLPLILLSVSWMSADNSVSGCNCGLFCPCYHSL